MERFKKKQSHCQLVLVLPPFFFILFFFCSNIISFRTSCLGIVMSRSSFGAADFSFQNVENIRDEEQARITDLRVREMQNYRAALVLARRLMSGPGSSPPCCTSKCGSCRPCKPVHVPVPPGTPVTAEYYPEAWRCKCGNKLYMP